jgi:hypothetical protein
MKLTNKRVNELSKQFAHIQKAKIASMAESYKTEKGLVNHLQRVNAEEEQEHNKPLPIYIEIEVEWSKNRTWGWCPRANMRWKDANGEWNHMDGSAYASGCGYDKHSTVLAECLNTFKNLRYAVRNKDFKKSPYGIYKSDYIYCYFEGGVGAECYPRIMDWLGYDMKHVAHGKTYDKWVIIKKSERKRFKK